MAPEFRDPQPPYQLHKRRAIIGCPVAQRAIIANIHMLEKVLKMKLCNIFYDQIIYSDQPTIFAI